MISKNNLIKVINDWLRPVLETYVTEGYNIMFVQSENEFKWCIPNATDFSTSPILRVQYDTGDRAFFQIYIGNAENWCIYIDKIHDVEYDDIAISSYPGIKGVDAFDLFNKIKTFKTDTTYVFSHLRFHVGQPYSCLIGDISTPAYWYLIKTLNLDESKSNIISIDMIDNEGTITTIYPQDIVSGKVRIINDEYESFDLDLENQIKTFVNKEEV